jgi:glyoxalase family protein
VRFYAGLLGLRLVKKSVNQDDPTVYHLFYADEEGEAGSDLTFFEYPGLVPGRAGDGMVHRVVWRVAGKAALDFWQQRLGAGGIAVERSESALRFSDPEGLAHELVVYQGAEAPLAARHPEIPQEVALQGFAGARAYASEPAASDAFLQRTLGFEPGYVAAGEGRSSFYAYDAPPAARGLRGAGTVHHVAWASTVEDHGAWRDRVRAGGGLPTPVIDRHYFKSIYFREPSGVLFEIATLGPGFAVDEEPAHLGERLSLPPAYEHLRAQLEPQLTPLPDPRREALLRSSG